MICDFKKFRFLNLFESKTEINQTNINEKLHESIRSGQLVETELLLDFGADPNYIGNNGLSGLHLAVLFNWEYIVKLLLQQEKINVNIKDTLFEETAMHHACCHSVKSNIIFDVLLNFERTDINETNMVHMTPLMMLINEYYATDDATRSMYRIKKILEHPDIRVNLIDEFGSSCIHTAVMQNNLYAAKLLLQNKFINIDIKDSKGRKPLDIATENENLRMAELLKLCDFKK
jgi:ankyrin repeat protein